MPPRNTYLLHLWLPIRVELSLCTFAERLLLGVDIHRDLKELLVKERYTRLETPRHRRLVGAQAVCCMQVLHALHAFLVERSGRRGGMEVQVSYVSSSKSGLEDYGDIVRTT